MAKKKGQNQSSARSANLALIMEEFQRHPMSRVDISRLFHLSKPAASKIAAELESFGLIMPSKDQKAYNQPGVKPVDYELNPNLGLIVVIDLSTVEVQLRVYDFAGAVLSVSVLSDLELIKYEDFINFRDCLKIILASDPFRTKKLLSICVAVPCAVNKHSGKVQWSPRFEIQEDFNIAKFFKQDFNTDVIIKNDVHLFLLAEQAGGLIQPDIKYALLLYIDTGIGGSFYFDSKLEDGQDGTAGDMGFYHVFDEGRMISLDSAASINAIKRKLRQKIAAKETTSLPDGSLRFKDIVSAYAAKDQLTTDTVNQTAKILAEALVNFINVFSVKFIVINGRIKQLGQGYLDEVNREINKTFTDVLICYSNVESAACEGAYIASRTEIIDDKISHRNQK